MTPPKDRGDDLAARMARTAAGRAATAGSFQASTPIRTGVQRDVLDHDAHEDTAETSTTGDTPQSRETPPATSAPKRGQGSRTPALGESSARAFQSAPKHHARRVTLDLTEEDHRALAMGRVSDGVPASERLRALVKLWREDADLADRVLRVARGE